MATYLNSKPRYEILDGLRGVAALIVVAFHLFETYSPGVPYQVLNHGYLAVDFFFVLSGFVIGYAYDDRWDRMSMLDFCKRRLIRLHPMLVIGTLFGACLFFLGGDHPDFPMIHDVTWWQVALCTLACLFLFPMSKGMDIRGWAELNPLNGAQWSLFWEYIANLLYAVWIRRLSRRALSVCVAVFALFTVLLAYDIDLFGTLKEREYAAYTMIGGWSLTADQIQIALTRLLYPFFCGLWLSRLSYRPSVKGGFWWCALIVAFVLTLPRVGGDNPANYWMNGTYELLCVLLVFPFTVALGAGSRITGRCSIAVCKFLGEISYPLYITHYPLIYVQMSWAATHPEAPLGTHVFVAVSLYILAIAFAYASLKAFDEPVREYLKRKWFRSRPSSR
jgi:peptidoglycan/LPS O-acetylase OafA/YrhL